jgi:hypothetical protein
MNPLNCDFYDLGFCEFYGDYCEDHLECNGMEDDLE